MRGVRPKPSSRRASHLCRETENVICESSEMSRSVTSRDCRRRSRRSIRAAAGIAALGWMCSLAALGVMTSKASADASAPGLSLIKRIQLPGGGNGNQGINNQGGEIIVDAKARHLFVACETNCPTFGDQWLHFVVYDLDTFALIKTILSNNQALMAQGFALDQQHHRLFQVTTAGTEVIDTQSLTIIKTINGTPTSATFGSQGLVYSAVDNVLYFVAAPPNQVPVASTFQQPGPGVYAYDPDSGQQLWSVALGCDHPYQAFAFPYVAGLSHDNKYLYTACQTAVARVKLGPASSTHGVDLFPGLVSGNAYTNAVYVPGLDRILVLSQTGSNGGSYAAYVFDGPSLSYVAEPTLFSAGNGNLRYLLPSIGVDPTTARFYAQSFAYANDAGSGGCNPPVLSTNSFSVAEASLAQNAAVQLPTSMPTLYGRGSIIAFDPAKHNLFTIDINTTFPQGCHGDATTAGPTTDVDVFHDSIPAAQSAGLADLDAATQDIPEVTGKTAANAAAQASAFGVRYLHAPTNTKSVTWGHVVNARLDGSEARGESAALDYFVPSSSSDQTDSLVTQAGSGYSSARCSDTGDGHPSSDPGASPAGTALASCSKDKETVDGSASNLHISSSSDPACSSCASPTQNLVMSVSSVQSSAHADRLDGSEGTAFTEVDGIDVQGVIHVDKLVVTASTHAHGRLGTNGARYTCTVTGLTAAGQTVAGPEDCQGADVQAAVAAANQLAAQSNQRVSVEFPSPYADAKTAPAGALGVVVQTSPRGYVAQVQASPLNQNQNLIFTGDKSIEQIGLVVTQLQDSPSQHERFVLSFGGVAARSTYGIFSLGDVPEETPSPDGSETPAPVAGGGAGGVGDIGGGGPTPPPTPAPPKGKTPPALAPLAAVVDGLLFLWQHPGLIPPLLGVWALLGLPAYVISRRHALNLATGVTS